MVNDTVLNDKRKALLAYKEKILNDIKYYEKRIDEFHIERSQNNYYEDDGSDSDNDVEIKTHGRMLGQLKAERSMLRTCLQATQELTSLQVLQSEINLMVNDPVLNGQPPVIEEGVWREVTADCRVDLVPFSISFYVHTSNRKFGPLSYRGLHVTLVKADHERELTKSVLQSLTRPSDAVELIRSYAAAHRSRRATLARLAEKFGHSLFMEPMAEGGYLLKCANLLEIYWTLQNKWSSVAPFHHGMKFDLEYMDESYIKTITQAHKQLSDPTVDTDERTQILSKIISTCLEAQGPTQELYDSFSSDPETSNILQKRRTTLDQEPEHPIIKPKDREVMAPPKSLPKRTKPKGKENSMGNRKFEAKAAKRTNNDSKETSGVKKIKTGDKVPDTGVKKVANIKKKDGVESTHSEVKKSVANKAITDSSKDKKEKKDDPKNSVTNIVSKGKSVANIKRKTTTDNVIDSAKKSIEIDNVKNKSEIKKSLNKVNKNTKKHITKIPTKIQKTKTVNTIFNKGNTGNENAQIKNTLEIPKKLVREGSMKLNPQRISPRKIPSHFKASHIKKVDPKKQL